MCEIPSGIKELKRIQLNYLTFGFEIGKLQKFNCFITGLKVLISLLQKIKVEHVDLMTREVKV